MWTKFLTVFLLCFAYKLIDSISDLCKICIYNKLYQNYSDEENCKIMQSKTCCINLFKKLNINDSIIPVSQKIGNNQIVNHTVSLFDNFPDDTKYFKAETLRTFQDAIGIAKHNLLQCFSPKYWIDLLLFLPKNIFTYLNVSADSAFIKFLQIIYWLMGVAITLFSSDISNFIKLFFTR